METTPFTDYRLPDAPRHWRSECEEGLGIPMRHRKVPRISRRDCSECLRLDAEGSVEPMEAALPR